MSLPLSVIIVSWNVREQLNNCLRVLLLQEPAEVVVVDNNSVDGSADLVMNNFPSVKLLRASDNLGFAKAVNWGMKQTSQELVLLLNPDTEIVSGSLKLAVNFFQSNQAVGVMGGQLQNLDGSIQKSVRRFPSLWSQVMILLKLNYLYPKLLAKYLWNDFNYTLPQIVDQVSGAFFFVRRSCWQQLGGLDEQFYIWFEEVDLCQRAVTNNWQVWFRPEIKSKHLGGQSFIQLNHQTRQSIFNHSVAYYFKKHHSYSSYLIIKISGWVAWWQAIILDLIKL